MKKLLILAAAGVGYVLGAKAGRERYEQIRQTFVKVKDDPRVQEKAQQVADVAREQAPVVKDRIAGAATATASKVKDKTSSSDRDELVDRLDPDSTARQADPYPQGTLP